MRSWHSVLTWGINLRMPVPSFGGKLKSMCVAYFLNFARISGFGVPRTLCTLVIWSSSFVPGKSGNKAMISNMTQPQPPSWRGVKM